MKAYNKVPVGFAGGLNKDLPSQDLDNQSWSEIHNLRMKDSRLIPVQGYAPVFAPLPQPPEHVLGLVKQGTPTLFIAGNGELHQNTNAIWTDVSRLVGGAYNTGVPWQSAVLNNTVFMNNGTDVLQVLEQSDTEFKDSASIPVNFRAKIFRGFKNYLFALNINEGVSDIPSGVRWSDPADPGLEPPSWDITDPTTQAGQLVLADTDGECVDAMQLRDQLMIYKTDSVYSCQFIGGVYVFSFQKVISDRGCLSTGCVAQFENSHFVVGFEDIYIHDGLQAKSISEGRIKNFFYNDLDQEYLDNVFTIAHKDEKEIWICYPNDDAIGGACNQALVWNWVSNVWTTRDIPNILDAGLAVIDPKIDDVWDVGLDDTWDLGGLHWDANNYSQANLSLVICSQEDDALYVMDDTATFDGATFTYALEKDSFAMGDANNAKYLNHLTPDVEGAGIVYMRFGFQLHLSEGVRWGPPSMYTLGKFRAYTRGQGRYVSSKFYGDTVDAIPSFGGFEYFITVEGEK